MQTKQVNNELISRIDEITLALQEMIQSEHYQPSIYLERLKELLKEVEREDRFKLPFKRDLMKALRELIDLIEREASPEELEDPIETLAIIIRESIPLSLDLINLINSYLSDISEQELDGFAKGLITMLEDIVKGNIRVEEAVAYLNLLSDLVTQLENDLRIFGIREDLKAISESYGQLREILKELKSIILSLDDISAIQDFISDIKNLILNFSNVISNLRASKVLQENSLLPSEDILEALNEKLRSKGIITEKLETPSTSPYLIRLREILNELESGNRILDENTIEIIKLIIETLKVKLRNASAISISLKEGSKSSARQDILEKISNLANSSLLALSELEASLNEEEPDLSTISSLISKLEENDRKIVKLITQLEEYQEVNYKYCPRCGHKNPIHATKCEKCGFIFSIDADHLIDVTDKPELSISESPITLPKDLQYPVINGKVLTDRIASIAQLVESYIKEEIPYHVYSKGIERHIAEIEELYSRYREYVRAKSDTVNSGLSRVKEVSEELYENLLEFWMEVNTTLEEAVEEYLKALDYLKEIDYTVRLEELKGAFEEIFDASNKLYEIIKGIYETEVTIKKLSEEEETGGEGNEVVVS